MTDALLLKAVKTLLDFFRLGWWVAMAGPSQSPVTLLWRNPSLGVLGMPPPCCSPVAGSRPVILSPRRRELLPRSSGQLTGREEDRQPEKVRGLPYSAAAVLCTV